MAAKKKSDIAKPMDVEYVFGLDIGTRNVVGTVGYMDDEVFRVIAQCTREHETRSMIDGQIHDIDKVAKVIKLVKAELEEKVGFALEKVCIAAAGRVLQTVTTNVEYEYERESVVTGEDLYTLDLLGVDKAHKELTHEDERYKFFCVGYTVMKYYLNDELFSSIEGHKADKIAEDLIVTFLPQDVVDGLYTAVERAGLYVANLTLEPIAAINVAIPEGYRMLNISLVDVGAGTSDICITNDGAIIAYGMIPYAGDEISEVLVKEYLVDFSNAEKIKKEAAEKDSAAYEDIMGIKHTVTSEEVWKVCEPVVDKITTSISEKILELNGGIPVSAVFIVGGGGKAYGFAKMLAQKLDIVEERVALRGEDVMKKVVFEEKGIKKDSLIVTPIGICLNYYEQSNTFIMVRLNGQIIKLYDNGSMKVVDAALAAGFTTEEIFPRRGRDLNFMVNGAKRMVRGREGESAKVIMNGREAGLNDTLIPNSEITIELSTLGENATMHISDMEEYKSSYVDFVVNGQRVKAPKFMEVNGELVTGEYLIKEDDDVETRSFYTVGQLTEFMDVNVDEDYEILVNNKRSSLDTIIYENFTVEWTISTDYIDEKTKIPHKQEIADLIATLNAEDESEESEDFEAKTVEYRIDKDSVEPVINQDKSEPKEEKKEPGAGLLSEGVGENLAEDNKEDEEPKVVHDISVTVNDTPITLKGKTEYIFVDIYNYYEFSTETAKGKRIVTKNNGAPCSFSDPIFDGDKIELYWEDRK